MKNKLFFILIIIAIASSFVSGELFCEITTACFYTDILHLSDTTDAHAEVPIFNSYQNKVCCRDTSDKSILSTYCDDFIMLHLSDTQDAQAEINTENKFNTNVCLSNDIYDLNCAYETSCDNWQTCVVSFSHTTNAHLGRCGTYDINLCCNFSDSVPVSPNLLPQISSLYIAQNVSKFQTLRIICEGVDQDSIGNGLNASLFMKTSESLDWNRLNDSLMSFDGNSFYYDYEVKDDGGIIYDAECHLTDGFDVVAESRVSIAKIIDDWDGDGINDVLDRFEGNSSDLDTDVSFDLEIDGEVILNPVGEQMVEFKDMTTKIPIIKFKFNFSEQSLELPNIKIRTNNTIRGAVLIKGLVGVNKTINVPKVIGDGRLCVKDAEVDSFDEITRNCDGANEYLFTTCQGTKINGMTCTDRGDYFEIAGLMNSAVKEVGSMSLFIWAEDNLVNKPTLFYSNYTNITSGLPIIGADCNIKFNDTTWLDMGYSNGLYNYSRTFIQPMVFEYLVNCSYSSFGSIQLNDTYEVIKKNTVPEFDSFLILIGLVGIIMIIFIIQRRKYR